MARYAGKLDLVSVGSVVLCIKAWSDVCEASWPW
jgi:hypothetical protein